MSSDDSDDDFVSSKVTDIWRKIFERGNFGDDFPQRLKIETEKSNQISPKDITAEDLSTILQTVRSKSKQNKTQWPRQENGIQHENHRNNAIQQAQQAINTLLGTNVTVTNNIQNANFIPPPSQLQINQSNHVSNWILIRMTYEQYSYMMNTNDI